MGRGNNFTDIYPDTTTVQTVQDKRECFCKCIPIFIEKLEGYSDKPIDEVHLSFDAKNRLNELFSRLRQIVSDQKDFVSENQDFSFEELVRLLDVFKSGPVRSVGPNDLTYINFRLRNIGGAL